MAEAPSFLSRKKLFPTLQSSPEVIQERLKSLSTLEDVAAILEIPATLLRSILYGRRLRDRYESFNIPKKGGGERRIDVAPKNLRILQAKLNTVLQIPYKPKACVHGFTRARSIVTNAWCHYNRRFVLNLDLLDFFHSIHIGRVIGVLKGPPFSFSEEAAVVVAQIACRADGVLPQGSPCSPIITNIVAFELDSKLVELARKYHCMYSRYADDLTFSTNKPVFPSELAFYSGLDLRLGPTLVHEISGCGFAINDKKTRLRSRKHRQEVTGITTNEFPNTPRAFVRDIRSIIASWRNHGYRATETELNRRRAALGKAPTKLGSYMRGKISYLIMVRGCSDCMVRRYMKSFNQVCPEMSFKLTDLSALEPSVLRGRIRTDHVSWESQFRRVQTGVKLIEVTIKDDQICGGTAFRIAPRLYATAGHNLDHGEVQMYLDQRVKVNKGKWLNEVNGRDVGLLYADMEPDKMGPPLASELRLPEIGEPVAAIGYPLQPGRDATLAMSIGWVESLPTNQNRTCRFINVSFPSGFGLSGGPLVDRRGYVIGIMIENTFMIGGDTEPPNGDARPRKPYGQAIPYEYLDDLRWATS